MDLLIEEIPKNLGYERLKEYVSSYAKTFTLKVLDSTSSKLSWNATLSIPNKVSSLMIVELLDGQKMDGSTISIKILEEQK